LGSFATGVEPAASPGHVRSRIYPKAEKGGRGKLAKIGEFPRPWALMGAVGAASPPLCPSRHPPQSVAACLSIVPRRILSRMGSKSRETIYGGSVRAAAERATEARKEADRLAVEAWNKRTLGFRGPAQGLPDTKVGTSRRRSMMRQRRKRDSDRHEERLEEDFLVRVEEQN
jgi:hypothetical protein